MSASEREWMSSPQEDVKPAWSVTKWLIVLNVGIFILGMVWHIRVPGMTEEVESVPMLYGWYSYAAVFQGHEYWRLITYQFLHANMGHLLFNMIALYFFGNLVEQVMGRGRYLLFYLLCGIGGALFSTFLGSMGLFHYEAYINIPNAWQMIPMVGASGSIYGILVAGAFIFPKIKVQLLFPPVVLTMRTLAIGLLCLATVIIYFNWNNAGGEAGHLGGMVMGFLLILFPFFRAKHARRQHREYTREMQNAVEQETNRILEKISNEGMDSLTPREREFIQRISQSGRQSPERAGFFPDSLTKDTFRY